MTQHSGVVVGGNDFIERRHTGIPHRTQPGTRLNQQKLTDGRAGLALCLKESNNAKLDHKEGTEPAKWY